MILYTSPSRSDPEASFMCGRFPNILFNIRDCYLFLFTMKKEMIMRLYTFRWEDKHIFEVKERETIDSPELADIAWMCHGILEYKHMALYNYLLFC